MYNLWIVSYEIWSFQYELLWSMDCEVLSMIKNFKVWSII